MTCIRKRSDASIIATRHGYRLTCFWGYRICPSANRSPTRSWPLPIRHARSRGARSVLCRCPRRACIGRLSCAIAHLAHAAAFGQVPIAQCSPTSRSETPRPDATPRSG
jgi:hypothetical protein